MPRTEKVSKTIKNERRLANAIKREQEKARLREASLIKPKRLVQVSSRTWILTEHVNWSDERIIKDFLKRYGKNLMV